MRCCSFYRDVLEMEVGAITVARAARGTRPVCPQALCWERLLPTCAPIASVDDTPGPNSVASLWFASERRVSVYSSTSYAARIVNVTILLTKRQRNPIVNPEVIEGD